LTGHPTLHFTDVRCATCGTTFTTRSTRESIVVETCSSCHPAYTGETRAIVSGDRIDKFERRRALAAAAA
jgi:large subunit ribosomal protein L31